MSIEKENEQIMYNKVFVCCRLVPYQKQILNRQEEIRMKKENLIILL